MVPEKDIVLKLVRNKNYVPDEQSERYANFLFSRPFKIVSFETLKRYSKGV